MTSPPNNPTNAPRTTAELNEEFGLPGLLAFDENCGLQRVRITLASCQAELYLQGAHLTSWKQAGGADVLFLSEGAEFAPGKAIRGGIPLCFPWFGARSDGGKGPSHGFARTEPWQVAFAAFLPGQEESLSLTLVLEPNQRTIDLGFSAFRAVCEFTFGRTLTIKLTVANPGDQPLHFEEALHTYFGVGDVHQAPLSGLESALYLDKRDGGKEKRNPADPLQLLEFSDRVYPRNPANVVLHDRKNRRTILMDKQNSATTVVWNPWEDGESGFADLAPGSWQHFLCVEAANTATDAISLSPGATHTLTLNVAVQPA